MGERLKLKGVLFRADGLRVRRRQTGVGRESGALETQGSRLLAECIRFGDALRPAAAQLDQLFDWRLRRMGFNSAEREPLRAITSSAGLTRVAESGEFGPFMEEVRYRGRRLAKLSLSPAAVLGALRESDSILDKYASKWVAGEHETLHRVRDQLNFASVLGLNAAFYEVRDSESETFYELFRVGTESRSVDEVLSGFLVILLRFTGAAEGRVYVRSDDRGAWIVRAGPGAGQSFQIEGCRTGGLSKPLLSLPATRALIDREWEGRFQSCWSVPLHEKGTLQGVMTFGFARMYSWLPRERELLEAAAQRCWQAAERTRMLEDLATQEAQIRQLAGRLVEVEESERQRISRELHDEAGQSLLCVRLQLEMLEQSMGDEQPALRKRLSEIRGMTEHTILEVRRLIAALSPAVLEQIGLAPAIRQLVGRLRSIHPAEVQVDVPRRLEVPRQVQIIVYRLFQEILNNVAKYSMAKVIKLSVRNADGQLTMQVEDDGVGFDVEAAFSRQDCYGLKGLRERVALLGGSLEVRSKPSSDDSVSGGEAVRSPSGGQALVRGTSIRIALPSGSEMRRRARSGMALE